MPSKNNHSTSAPSAGASTSGRTKRPKAGSQSGRQTATDNAIFADSIYSLKLGEKRGTDVFFAHAGKDVDTDEMKKVYAACRDAFIRGLWLLKKEKTSFDPLASGISMGTSLYGLLDGLRKMVPRDFEINIDHSETYKRGKSPHDWYITIFQQAPWDLFHHYIEAGPALLKLSKKNKTLHDLFLIFLRHLECKGMDLWDRGMMGNDLEMMQERIMNCDYDDEKQKEDYESCYRDYRQGEPASYAKLIRKQKLLPPAELAKRANRFKAGNPIANVIYQGAQLLDNDHTFRQFAHYLPHEDFYEQMFLDFESQVTIIWKEGDALSMDAADSMEAISNEGVQMPILAVRLDAGTKDIDFDKMNAAIKWLADMNEFIPRAQTLIDSYIP